MRTASAATSWSRSNGASPVSSTAGLATATAGPDTNRIAAVRLTPRLGRRRPPRSEKFLSAGSRASDGSEDVMRTVVLIAIVLLGAGACTMYFGDDDDDSDDAPIPPDAGVAEYPDAGFYPDADVEWDAGYWPDAAEVP